MPLGPREKGRSTKRERDGNLLSDREGAKTALEKTIDLINESISQRKLGASLRQDHLQLPTPKPDHSRSQNHLVLLKLHLGGKKKG